MGGEGEKERSCNERMTKPTVAPIKMSRSHSYGQMVYCSGREGGRRRRRTAVASCCGENRRKQSRPLGRHCPRNVVGYFGADFFPWSVRLTVARPPPPVHLTRSRREGGMDPPVTFFEKGLFAALLPFLIVSASFPSPPAPPLPSAFFPRSPRSPNNTALSLHFCSARAEREGEEAAFSVA